MNIKKTQQEESYLWLSFLWKSTQDGHIQDIKDILQEEFPGRDIYHMGDIVSENSRMTHIGINSQDPNRDYSHAYSLDQRFQSEIGNFKSYGARIVTERYYRTLASAFSKIDSRSQSELITT